MPSLRNLLHPNKRHSAVTADATPRPSEDKADKTGAEHHESAPTSAQHLSVPRTGGHRRNISDATAATSARSSMDTAPGTQDVSQQLARTVDHAGRQGFTGSGVMGYESLAHNAL